MPVALPSFLLQSQGWRGRLTGFILGGLCVLGHAPLHLWGLSLLGLALLFLRLRHLINSETPFKSGFHSAFWFGLGYFGVGVFWVGSAFISRGAAFIPVMPPMVLALAALLALFWGLAGAAFVKSRLHHAFVSAIGFVSLFMLAEFARGYLFGGLPWNLPGYIFPAGSLPSQLASIWTIYGQSLLVLFMSACLGLMLATRHKVRSTFLLILSLAGLYGFGAYRLSNLNLTYHPNIKLRIVSVPFDQADKFDPEKSVDIVNQFLTESVKSSEEANGTQGPLSEITHIIWPEGAVSGLAIENDYLLGVMGFELARQLEGELPVWLLNSLRMEQRPDPNGGEPIDDYYNSSVAVTFTETGIPAVAAYNDKAKLVPFGEFIPFGKWMEAKNVPVISTSLLSISPAKRKTLAKFPRLPLGSPQICYEVVFPGFTPQAIDGEKAAFILNQSNDAWFGKSWGPYQHANIAQYRAIEEGLPLIRAASNGVSGIIDPYGRILSKTVITRPDHIDVALPQAVPNHGISKQIIFFLFLINFVISLMCATFGRVLSEDRN